MRAVGIVVCLLVFSVSVASAEQPKPTAFTDEVRRLFRLAACGGDDKIPERYNTKTITRHCKQLAEVYAAYKKRWVDKAVPFMAEVRPKDLPRTVIYPFGGGDLSSALAVFPDATELTTISLEAAGDVRAIDTIKMAQLASDLLSTGEGIRRLYHAAHSTTESLQKASHSTLPGTLMFALAGMVVHDMQPVALRYFDIQRDGTLRYLSAQELDTRAAELAKRGTTPPKKITHFWYQQTSAFANVEIQFRPQSDPNAPLRTYRHIVMNLDDTHLGEDDRVLVHLRAKGKVSVMTKAASFLLWYDDFTKIRDYLLKHIAWMVSDASGIPPSHAKPAGFEQVTYGEFAGPYFIFDKKNTRAEFIKLWKSQPRRALGFRFGYPDVEKKAHLMITRPMPNAQKPQKP
jgi:hypothetical protein